MTSALVCQPGNCPDGIYVSPSPSVEDEWSAVIFLHKGPYAGSVLRFRFVFPAAFPARAPSVYFAKGSLIHPLVDVSNVAYVCVCVLSHLGAVTVRKRKLADFVGPIVAPHHSSATDRQVVACCRLSQLGYTE